MKLLKILIVIASLISAVALCCQKELFWAMKEGSLWKVKELVTHGASVNTPNEKGVAPLIYAVNFNPRPERRGFASPLEGAGIQAASPWQINP